MPLFMENLAKLSSSKRRRDSSSGLELAESELDGNKPSEAIESSNIEEAVQVSAEVASLASEGLFNVDNVEKDPVGSVDSLSLVPSREIGQQRVGSIFVTGTPKRLPDVKSNKKGNKLNLPKPKLMKIGNIEPLLILSSSEAPTVDEPSPVSNNSASKSSCLEYITITSDSSPVTEEEISEPRIGRFSVPRTTTEVPISGNSVPGSEKEAFSLKVRCTNCQKSRVPCLKDRPTCLNCLEKRLDCNYKTRTYVKNKDANKTVTPLLSLSRALAVLRAYSSSSTSTTVSDLGRSAGSRSGSGSGSTIRPDLISNSNQSGSGSGFSSTSLLSLKPTIAIELNTEPMTNPSTFSDPKDKFMKKKLYPIPDSDLPTIFIRNYFYNYETRIPFITYTKFMKTSEFSSIDFKVKNYINMDMYLLLSIGCLLHDKITNSSLYSVYFSVNDYKSIADVTDESTNEGLKISLLLLILNLNLISDVANYHFTILNSIASKLIVKYSHLRGNQQLERLIWSIYNLEKPISLIFKKSGFLQFVKCSPLKFIDSNVSEELIDLINLEMTYSKLQDKLIEFKFNKESDPTLIEQLKFDIQIWREQSTTVINSYFESPQEHECLVAINYYYFLIELNEVSARKSLPLIHSFHSFSFALLMNYSESGFEKLSQVNVRLALHSLFWYQKLFKVVEYCLTCVKVDINTPRSISSNLDFMNKFFTLENMVKLLTYISNQKRNYCPSKIEFFLYNLSLLVKKMATYLANYNAFDRNEINQEIDKTIDKLFRKKVHRE